jgi:DNA mismatch repair protein MutS
VTGIVEEYLALAEAADADLLAMQVGDFYEFFADDARTVAAELDLKVSEKSSHGSSYPMAGVPVDDLDPYLVQLVERGYRVAVADQREDGEEIVRELTRVVTPGTLMEGGDATAQYLAAAVEGADRVGLAFADVTTGQFRVTEVDGREDALAELYRFDPAEVLPGPTLRDADALLARLREREVAATLHGTDAFAPGRAAHRVREQFGAGAAESVGLDEDGPGIRAAGAVLDYVAETRGVTGSLSRLRPYRADEGVNLDRTTQRNLELVETMSGGGQSLFDTVDHTVTAAGGRRLREWLTRPIRDRGELDRRQGCVAALADAPLAREGIREELDGVGDLERLASRAASGTADAHDLAGIRDALARLPAVADAVAGAPALAESPLGAVLDRPDREALAALREELADALVADPPATPGEEGGLFRRGYDDDLDSIIEGHEEIREFLDGLADRETERLGITHLQVDRNKTDGYYIQVGKSETDAVPESYREVKTLKNARRYTTEELAERERELLGVEERRAGRERELLDALIGRVADAAPALQTAGRALAELDCLGALAVHAADRGWVRPELAEDRALSIVGGRHPVVEETTEFVPNDARLGPERRFLVVTGPNMSGKSTYMRQVALITLLAQVGSFVPAEEATVGLVDGIYTRVGALDELAQGRSTFMVEMQELSNILHSATAESLVILDEVGRGTATYDGISIAWAATEYLHNEIGATTLFATHYHELTTLSDHLDGVHNVHMAATEDDGDVTFRWTVEEGAADRSYGVHVADLAGVPGPVVDRGRDVLDRLREEKSIDVRGSDSGTTQAVFDLESGQFRGSASADGGEGEGESLDPETESVLRELRETDVEATPPVDLMAAVQEWQERLEGG